MDIEESPYRIITILPLNHDYWERSGAMENYHREKDGE